MAEQSYGDWIRSNPPRPTKEYKTKHMAQQTAVEWLEKQLTLALGDELKDLRGLFVVAKEMEKEQIGKAYYDGYYDAEGQGLVSIETQEQYYNETYKTQAQ